MSCSPYDLRDYLFEELTPGPHAEVRAHLKTCEPCTAELQALRATQTALLSVREEEIPQRIGFVSDKVFEPSPIRRWFAGFWTSAARLGFLSAAMLSAAILVYALRPAQIVHNSAQSASITQAQIARQINHAVAAQVAAQVRAQVDGAVARAVADTEERAQKRTNELLAAAETRAAREHNAMLVAFRESQNVIQSRLNFVTMASNQQTRSAE
jgi:anti-sigma factor RsiW